MLHCTGKCCTPVTKALGVVVVPQVGEAAFAAPATLTADSELKLGAPLISPHHAYSVYLSCIFTWVLTNSLSTTNSWLGQILGAWAWLQVAILSGFPRETAMHAMRKAVAKAYARCPHTH